MSLTVQVPNELARRLEAVAATRQLTAEEVALEAIEAQLPAEGEDPLEAFIGSGHSGRGDLARRHREILADAFADKTARDV